LNVKEAQEYSKAALNISRVT